jgi:hypothetical protein
MLAEVALSTAVALSSASLSLMPSGFGLLPSENTGSLGPAMRADDANVLEPGRVAVTFHGDAANYLTLVGNERDGLYQQFERQTLSVEVRRGVKQTVFPALEVGLRLDARRRAPGMLNGFISGWESTVAGLTKDDQWVNDDRIGEYALTGTGEELVQNGRVLRRSDGRSKLSFGEAAVTMKALLVRMDPARKIPQLAARLVVDLARPGALDANGDFLGAGLSVAQPLTRRLTAHGDARFLKPVTATDELGLALRPGFGATAGVEWRALKKTSLGLQVSWDRSPVDAPGLWADEPRSDLTVGVSHLAKLGTERVLLQAYLREDVLFDGSYISLFPYSPPDLQAGVRATWFPAIRAGRRARAR